MPEGLLAFLGGAADAASDKIEKRADERERGREQASREEATRRLRDDERRFQDEQRRLGVVDQDAAALRDHALGLKQIQEAAIIARETATIAADREAIDARERDEYLAATKHFYALKTDEEIRRRNREEPMTEEEVQALARKQVEQAQLADPTGFKKFFGRPDDSPFDLLTRATDNAATSIRILNGLTDPRFANAETEAIFISGEINALGPTPSPAEVAELMNRNGG